MRFVGAFDRLKITSGILTPAETIAFFQNLRSVRASSSIWAISASSPGSNRGFQAHVPWSDSTSYFDTSGCCTADITRINLNISTFPDYSGDATWGSRLTARCRKPMRSVPGAIPPSPARPPSPRLPPGTSSTARCGRITYS